MQTGERKIPIETVQLFQVLDKLLIALLQSLTREEWNAPTIAKLWSVKDIAAHLLDTQLRGISILRDHHFGDPPPSIQSYGDLVTYLNQLNMNWTSAFRRISPPLLIELLETTGTQFRQELEKLPPFDTAVFAVSWAGVERSANWFHIAREYTERFIHQQQIREAVGKQALFTRELFYPFIDTFMQGLPYTYRNLEAATGTQVTVKINTEIGGEWQLVKKDNWELTPPLQNTTSQATISLDPDTAWKLFSKGISPAQAIDQVKIEGDRRLGAVALQLVAVMA